VAVTDRDIEEPLIRSEKIQLDSFTVEGLFGSQDHTITFPHLAPESSAPEILIVEGQNGTGKTTIMRMIAGILDQLNFDTFRRVPFKRARLTLSNGHYIHVESDRDNTEYPLIVTNGSETVSLAKMRGADSYTPEQMTAIEGFRDNSLPVVRQVDFQLVTIGRSLELEILESEENPEIRQEISSRHRRERKRLSGRVRNFLRDAQVNYRRFFQADSLELLPRILKRFENMEREADPAQLQERINALRNRSTEINRFGLQTDEDELQVLEELLNKPKYTQDAHSLSLLASYVEIHENRNEARDLIATRLSLFETIMDEFLVGKQVRISVGNGLDITTNLGPIKETDLSSGEYHFLYMMVAALLCERWGTILAIDEPELSLHVSWQRRLVKALSDCASGAAPIFYLSTHSTAISAAFSDKVQRLSAID
jgi:predicted ATPase